MGAHGWGPIVFVLPLLLAASGCLGDGGSRLGPEPETATERPENVDVQESQNVAGPLSKSWSFEVKAVPAKVLVRFAPHSYGDLPLDAFAALDYRVKFHTAWGESTDCGSTGPAIGLRAGANCGLRHETRIEDPAKLGSGRLDLSANLCVCAYDVAIVVAY